MSAHPPIREGLEVLPASARELMQAGAIVLDVRLAEELEVASVGDCVHVPLHELSERLDEVEDALDDAAEGTPLLVLCHHGVRSLKATLLLHEAGFASARSIAGGIERWSSEVDAGVPRYVRDGARCTIVG